MKERNALFLSLLCFTAAAGCQPDFGICDEDAARRVVYSDDELGLPASVGQALVEQSCGGGSYCHSAVAQDHDRRGAPAGLDFDGPR